MTLASRMQEAVNRSGDSPRAFAGAIDVSPQALSDILNGKTKALKAHTALQAAKRGKVSPYWLVLDEGPKDPSEIDRVAASSDLSALFSRKLDRLNEASRLHIYNLIDHLLSLQSGSFRIRRGKSQPPSHLDSV